MRYKIPVTAKKTREIRGIIKDGEYRGKELMVSIYEGEASQGAQSDYRHIPHIWIKIEGGGWAKPEFKRFSGKNIAIVQQQIEKIKMALM